MDSGKSKIDTMKRETYRMLDIRLSRPGSRPRATHFLLGAATVLHLVIPLAVTRSALAEGEAVRTPKVTVAEPTFETGEVARDQVVEHSFRIRNSGSAPLEILKIMAPPNLEIVSRPSTLAPGETGELRVRVPLLFEKPGGLLKQIDLRTNDPATPSLVLELKFLSTEYVVPKPGYARWISVQHEKRGTISQAFTAADGKEFQILRTSTPPAGITLAVSATETKPGSPKEWKLDLTLGDDAPVGAITGTLLVYVNHPKQSIVPIPLSGFMRPVMAVTPNALDYGELNLTVKLSQTFNVQAFSTEPIHVTRVEHDLKGFPPASLETLRNGREYRIKLDLDPATMPKGVIHGFLKIHTDSAKEPLLIVPIDGTVK